MMPKIQDSTARRVISSAHSIRAGLMAGIALVVFGVSAASAQDAAPAASKPASAKSGDLEEVVVTARRVEESSQRVPVAITALSSADLRDRKINSRDELTQNIAGLTNNASGAAGEQGGIFLIRGQGESFGGTPGVITYFADVAGIALGNQNQSPLTIDGRPGTYIDLQNVQVLKGPQGTLFGRNATGGNVLFVPQRPTDKFEGYMTAGYGNYGDLSFEGAMSVPLAGDTLLARISGGVEKRDGFVKDVVTGNQSESLNYQTARISLLFKPTSNFENYLIGRYYNSDDGGSAFILTTGNPALNPQFVPLAAQQQAWGPRKVSFGPEHNYSKTRYWQAVNTTTWEISKAFTLKNIISYAYFSNAYSADVDGTAQPILMQTSQFRPKPENNVFTEEFQASGKLLEDHLSYTAGVYADHAGTITPFIQDFEFYPFVSGSVPEIPDGIIPGVKPVAGFPAILTFDDTSSSKAVYGQVTLDLGIVSPALEGLKLTGGGRYTRETSRSDAWTVISVLEANHSLGNYKNSYPSFSFGVDYQVTPSTLLYASVRDAYKSGGVNAQVDPASQFYTYAPEKLVSYEAGAKSRFGGPMAQFQIAADAFLGNYTDMQRSVQDVAVAPAAYIDNVSQARIKGIEMDASARFFHRLGVAASYAYTDSGYTKITDPAAVAVLTGAPFPYVAKNRFTISADYTLPYIPERIGSIRVSLNHTYQSKLSFAQSNTPSVIGQYLPGYALWNAGVNWDDFMGMHNVGLSAYVRNIGNRNYVLSRFDFYTQAGFITSQYGEPRTYGLQLRYTF